jgi:hypothetical protein
MHLHFVIALLLPILAASLPAQDSRLSGAVAFGRTTAGADAWLTAPASAFVEAWVRFPADLDNNVIFGIDEELLEGLDAPYHVAGGDWMALTGVQRTGMLWVAKGTAATLAGTPSTERAWELIPLGAALQPDAWYRIRTVANFAQRRFVSFSIDGPGLSRTVDLSGLTLDYPNYMPFDGHAMTSYVWSMAGTGLGTRTDSTAAVFFDDISFGYLDSPEAAPAANRTVADGFEIGPAALPAQPLPTPTGDHYVIPLNGYHDGTWYLERDESRAARLRTGFAHSGSTVMVCDALLRNAAYSDWLGEIVRRYGATPPGSADKTGGSGSDSRTGCGIGAGGIALMAAGMGFAHGRRTPAAQRSARPPPGPAAPPPARP